MLQKTISQDLVGNRVVASEIVDKDITHAVQYSLGYSLLGVFLIILTSKHLVGVYDYIIKL